MNELALFAGAGGGILGGRLLGWRTVCAVEREPAAQRMLLARQDDGCLEPFPIWDDVCTFDGKPWRGVVDIVTGGFPCQDISAAGKGEGITGERSGLWKEMARIICEVGPRFVLVENSPVLTSRGLGVVLGDLAAMGYDARWGVLGAVHAGAPHKRERIWIVANANGSSCKDQRMLNRSLDQRISSINESERRSVLSCVSNSRADVANAKMPNDKACVSPQRLEEGSQVQLRGSCSSPDVADSNGERRSAGIPKQEQRKEGITGKSNDSDSGWPSGSSWWLTEPAVGRVAHGVAARVDRLRALGNGQVPAVAALAWETLKP